MSADRSAVVVSGGWQIDVRSLRVLRYAIGSTIAMALAMGIGWQLAFLTPVLSLSFLAAPGPRPTLKQGMAFLSTIAVACLAGLLLGKFFISYPLVYVPLVGFVLLRLFYMKASGRSPMLTMWLIITLLLLPLIVMSSPQIAAMLALGFFLNAVVTVSIVWLTHGIMPDPLDAHTGVSAPSQAPAIPPAIERFRMAAVSALVVLPVLVLFYSLQLYGGLLILIFVGILSSQPGFASNFKGGAVLIIGNVIGGIAAIAMYELLVLVPRYEFLIALTLLAGLFFGARLFSDKPTAKLYGMAFSTLLLVIGSTTGSGSTEAGSKVYARVLQITVAVVYVVLAFGVADRFVRRKEVAT